MRTFASSIGRVRTGIALALALICASLAIFGMPTQTSAADMTVTINSFAFMPGTITVPAGTRVVWVNQQMGVPHTATSDTGVWDSGNLTTGQSFAFTFSQAGTFAYHCTIHPNMHATVVVTAAAPAQGQAAVAPSTPRPPAAAPVATAAPARAATMPAALPRTGGGAMATHIVGDEARPPFFGAALAGVIVLAVGGATLYTRTRRRT